MGEFKPNVIVYVVDDRQSLHFEQLFSTARKWGYADVELIHVAFGKILGKDGKPSKTREGEVVGLELLLDEAIARALALVVKLQEEAPPEERMSEDECKEVAEAVGLGSVKFGDLAQHRMTDYVFDWDKMINLQGFTAPYVQYAFARNRSIFRRGEIDVDALVKEQPTIFLADPRERTLGLTLLQYPEALEQAAADYRPNLLANYLYELANAYSAFFRDCPVLKAPTEELHKSRLALCELTARTLKHGLNLLGIQTVERM
jgi:arginyl-tRNA synthetase